ncbi:MAG: hypothetical protein WCF67_10605 [Chitinophagaceae bacterium]
MNAELTEQLIIKDMPLKEHHLHLSTGVDMSRLLNVPHLFGRYVETRNGFVVDPIGVLTMQPDGRITGYSHTNEGSWIPYDHGTVSRDKAFAFINAQNSWIPSSTWQQTLGDMPIGHFCNEWEGLKKLCLIPHSVATKKTRIVYLVASCLKFYKDGRTIPHLLKQLFAEGIEPNRIKVVINGAPESDNREIDGVSYAFTTHNAWEWSALYEAPSRWNFDYAMLIHDTNDILPGFRRKVEEFNDHLTWDYLPATPNAACLIGLYSFDFLERLNPWLESIDRIDKRNGVIAEVAGELLLRAKTALIMGDPERSGASSRAEWREHIDKYNTGTPRHRRVFPSINMHKYIHSGGQPSSPESL